MGKKIEEIAAKIYKPEILNCPKCGNSLKYKYTISNKVVQFTSGKYFRIKNLGYGCPYCNDSNIYFSQTANKLCFKGYTYSVKIACMIDYYKKQHMGREGICDILASKGIEISDRNVDIIHSKFKEYLNQDYDKIIKEAFINMLKEFNEIRLSIDLITINSTYYIIIYDFFTSKKLAIWIFDSLESNEIKERFANYIANNHNITLIATIRNTKEGKLVPLLKKLTSNNTKFISFNKF